MNFETEVQSPNMKGGSFLAIGEIIKIVLEASKSVYDWIKDISDKQREAWIEEVKALQISNWEGTKASSTSTSQLRYNKKGQSKFLACI